MNPVKKVIGEEEEGNENTSKTQCVSGMEKKCVSRLASEQEDKIRGGWERRAKD